MIQIQSILDEAIYGDLLTEAGETSNAEEVEKQRRRERERARAAAAREKAREKEKNIIRFSTINTNTCRFYVWPDPDKTFNSSQWLNYRYVSPVAKMEFVYNLKNYAISISASLDPDHGGWRCIDRDEPPVAWVSPESCEYILRTPIFKKFKSRVIEVIREYLRMKPSEVFEKLSFRGSSNTDASPADVARTMSAIRITLQKIIDDKVDNFNYNN